MWSPNINANQERSPKPDSLAIRALDRDSLNFSPVIGNQVHTLQLEIGLRFQRRLERTGLSHASDDLRLVLELLHQLKVLRLLPQVLAIQWLNAFLQFHEKAHLVLGLSIVVFWGFYLRLRLLDFLGFGLVREVIWL
jgi:hypothetical protein